MKTCRKGLHQYSVDLKQCPVCNRLNNIKYYKNNPEYNKAKSAKYRQNNPDYNKIKSSEFRQKNPEYKTNYERERKKRDPIFKLRGQLSSLIHCSLQAKGYTKRSKTFQLVGLSFKDLYEYLVQTAIKNYGSYDPTIKYHIDHIVPCAFAKTEKDLIKLQFYTNLQYLKPADNLKKHANLNFKIKKDT